MKKVGLALGVLAAVLCFWFLKPEARLSNNNRRAVVLEAFHALRPSSDGGCDKTIPTGPNGKCVSNWNYLNDDNPKYNVVKGWYGCNSSVWTYSGDGSGCSAVFSAASFYGAPGTYGYGTFGGYYGAVGRGGQCKYFANLLLYRSASYPYLLPTYASMWNNVEMDLRRGVPGDILTSPPWASPTHTAIVVEIKKTNGIVTGLDVIDSNWVTDTGVLHREVIGRHVMLISDYQGKFGIWKGVSYYYEPYVP